MFSNCAREDSWESFGLQGDQTSQSKRKSTLNIHWKDWYWNWSSNIWATWCKERFLGKDPNAGKDWRREEKGAAQDKMLGWRHRLSGHELELTPKDSGGQRSPEDCSPWGRKEWNTTWWLNSNRKVEGVQVWSIETLAEFPDYCSGDSGSRLQHQLFPESPVCWLTLQISGLLTDG